MTQKTAIEYIKESSIYTSPRYEWLKPIIEATLNETLDAKLIDETLKSIYVNHEQKEQLQQPETEDTSTVELESFTINKIKSINKINNIGLVDLSNPVELKDGLNIVYGKNASGKSSIVTAICNVLGIKRPSIPNLNKDSPDMFVSIEAIDADQNSKELNWPSSGKLILNGLKIFDSDVCTYLVEKDQLNDFELSHLKSELFPLLNNSFETLSEHLEYHKNSLNENFQSSISTIQKIVLQFSENSQLFSKDSINKVKLSEEQKASLEQLKSKLKAIQDSNPDATLKNLKTSYQAGAKILNTIGDFNEVLIDEENKKVEWEFKLADVITTISGNLNEYLRLKSIVDKESENKLGDLLLADWLKNPKWKEFIAQSILFVDSLDQAVSQKYKSSSCPYCLQELESGNAKKLIEAYHTLRNENKILLEKAETSLSNNTKELKSLIGNIGNFPDYLELFNNELEAISETEKTTIDFEKTNLFFNEIAAILEKKVFNEIDLNQIEELRQFGGKILQLEAKYLTVIKSVSDSITGRDDTIKAIQAEIAPLETNQIILDNKDSLISCISLKESLDNILQKIADLTAIKQATSSLSTRFTREVPLDIFENQLKLEYQALGHSITDVWSIKSQTDGPRNKRVYSIKDKRISEIFSEGEQKVHALADFFAEAVINKFKGVYIFDDPVNSLDEEKIELVKNRIMKLVEEENQVLIFTHNLVFLNSLIETETQKITQVTRLSDQILFEHDILLGTDNELSRRIKVIKERMQNLNSNEELQKDIYFLRNVYDLISGYLESYVEIKVFCNVINRYRPNIRMHSLDRLEKFNYDIVKSLMPLYHQTSRKGSRHSHPSGAPEPNYDELKGHYKTFLKNYSL